MSVSPFPFHFKGTVKSYFLTRRWLPSSQRKTEKTLKRQGSVRHFLKITVIPSFHMNLQPVGLFPKVLKTPASQPDKPKYQEVNSFRWGEKTTKLRRPIWGRKLITLCSLQAKHFKSSNLMRRKKHAPGKKERVEQRISAAEFPGQQEKPVKLAKPPAPSHPVVSQGKDFRIEGDRNFPSPQPWDVQPNPTTRWRLYRLGVGAGGLGGGSVFSTSSPPGRTAQCRGEPVSPPTLLQLAKISGLGNKKEIRP